MSLRPCASVRVHPSLIQQRPSQSSLASDPLHQSVHLSLLQQSPPQSSLASDPSYASVRVHLSRLQLTEATLVLRLASDPLHQSVHLSLLQQRPSHGVPFSLRPSASVRVHLSLLQQRPPQSSLVSYHLRQSESISAFSNRGHPSPL